MNFKTLGAIWLPSWLALVPVGMAVVGPHGHSPETYISGGAFFALPLSLAPALAAAIGLFVRRRKPDGGRYLAAWLAVAATLWIGSSTLDLQKAPVAARAVAVLAGEAVPPVLSPDQDRAKVDHDTAVQTAVAVGAIGLVLGTINAFMYFAEPRIGARRLVAILAVVAAIGTMVALAFTVLAWTEALATLVGVVSLTVGLATLFILLFGLAAVRWIKVGFLADRSRSDVAAKRGPNGGPQDQLSEVRS